MVIAARELGTSSFLSRSVTDLRRTTFQHPSKQFPNPKTRIRIRSSVTWSWVWPDRTRASWSKPSRSRSATGRIRKLRPSESCCSTWLTGCTTRSEAKVGPTVSPCPPPWPRAGWRSASFARLTSSTPTPSSERSSQTTPQWVKNVNLQWWTLNIRYFKLLQLIIIP